MKQKMFPRWATTVTPLSRFLAVLLFILLPTLAFFFGRYYEKVQYESMMQIIQSNTIDNSVVPLPSVAPAGCYYASRCMGLRDTPCQKILVCPNPTTMPRANGYPPPNAQ